MKIRMIQVILGIVFCLVATAAIAEKEESSTDCKYEVVQVFENGVLVSETKTRRCVEESNSSTKFDPDNNLGDYVKKKAVDLGTMAILISIIKD